MRAIAEQGFSVPTPIQAQAIPIVLRGADLLATAQTGTGKTAGFVLPILDRLGQTPRQKGAPRRIRALILTPTRELAAQVEQNIRSLGAYANFNSMTIYGGTSMRAQIQTLQRGVDILVATPGRLLDHVQQRTIDLRNVEIFVLDEADRMLDMGFMPDVRRIAALLASERQTLMFSATFSAQMRQLAAATLNDPEVIDVARANQTVDLVTQEIYMIAQEQKSAFLKHLISTEDLQQVLVFTKTKHGADRLATALERSGISADAIHGDKRQSQRARTLDAFKRGGLQVMVATDVAARGIDISGLPSVVNFDVPNTPDAYVHRIGRTGRAGAKGRAISLVTPAERGAMSAVERHIKIKIERRTPQGFAFHAPVPTSARPASHAQVADRGDSMRTQETPRHARRPSHDAARSYASKNPSRDGARPYASKSPSHDGARPYATKNPSRDGARPYASKNPSHDGARPYATKSPSHDGTNPFAGKKRSAGKGQGQPRVHARDSDRTSDGGGRWRSR